MNNKLEPIGADDAIDELHLAFYIILWGADPPLPPILIVHKFGPRPRAYRFELNALTFATAEPRRFTEYCDQFERDGVPRSAVTLCLGNWMKENAGTLGIT